MKNRAKPETLRTMKKIEPYIWLLPSILMMGCMIMIPIFNVFRASVTEISKVGVYKALSYGPLLWSAFPPSSASSWLWY